jgi:hypothetical protein
MCLDFSLSELFMREDPMTVHIILPGENNTLVWVADTKEGVEPHTVLYTEKITYIQDQCVAISAWGENAFRIREVRELGPARES